MNYNSDSTTTKKERKKTELKIKEQSRRDDEIKIREHDLKLRKDNAIHCEECLDEWLKTKEQKLEALQSLKRIK